MSDVIAAADETAFTQLLFAGEALIGTQSTSGSGGFGPFNASYSASVGFSSGTVVLAAPNVVELDDVHLNYSVSLSFGIDLNDFLPHFCLPRICVFGICTPKICVSWPTISIPFSFSDTVAFSADFTLNPHLSSGNWLIDIMIDSVPLLQFGPVTAGILTALGVAIAAAVGWVPFIGPFVAAAVIAIVAAIGVAGLTGLLGSILTPFVSGLTFTIYKQPQLFPLLPASGPTNPEVDIKITSIGASVQQTDKNELVITGDFIV